MSERTALEIADKFDELSSIMRNQNVPTLPKLHEYGKKATDMLRSQHAEIERLTVINSDLTGKSNSYVIENARQAEEIERLTSEREAAIAAAVLAERNSTIEQLREWADELGFTNSWRWKTPGGLLYRAAEMVSDRSKP